jgi:hypothetical protein
LVRNHEQYRISKLLVVPVPPSKAVPTQQILLSLATTPRLMKSYIVIITYDKGRDQIDTAMVHGRPQLPLILHHRKMRTLFHLFQKRGGKHGDELVDSRHIDQS